MAAYKNQAGFSPEKIKLLEEDLAGLNESGSDLAERAVRYVVDGEDAEVLEALSRAHKPAERLRLSGSVHGSYPSAFDCEARVAFFSSIEQTAHEAYLRLAKVYEAASKGGPPPQLHYQAYYGNLPWLETFLTEALRGESGYGPRRGQPTALPIDLLERMLAADGRDPALLMKTVFSAEPHDYMRLTPVLMITKLCRFGDAVLRHRELVSETLLRAEAPRRIELLEILSDVEAAGQAFLKELVTLATCSAKTVREATVPLLSRVSEEARPLVEAVAVGGSSAERVAAICWLGRFARENVRDFLLTRQSVEKGAKLQEAIAQALEQADPSRRGPQCEGSDLPLAPVETNVPLPAAAKQIVRDLFETYNRLAVEQNQENAKRLQQHLQRYPSTYPRQPQHELPLYDEGDVHEFCNLLATTTDLLPFMERERYRPRGDFKQIHDRVSTFAAIPEVRLIHVVRLLGLLGFMTYCWERPMMHSAAGWHLRHFHDHHPPGFQLRELAVVLKAVGVDPIVIGYDLLSKRTNLSWLSDQFAAYFAKYVDLLEMGLDNRPLAGKFEYEWRDVRTNTLEMIEGFPQLPPILIGRIWQIAIGSGKTDRAAAQQIIARLPDFCRRLADALASGDYPTRVVAAEWVGRSGDKKSAELLHKALAKEKQESAKDAMLTALERLGESIDRYLDRDQLLAEAERNLKKGLHKDLAWFPTDSWPEVRWHDSRKPVPAEILNWFLAQTFKLGSPEAGALLRRYCQQFQPERKGWTIDELADRTVPTAGFDENLSLELDYGPRQITARLQRDLAIGLTDESGKTLKSLPEPRKDDDPDKAKAAKKALSAAKSDLKKLVSQQTARLYEAMCTERTWPYADWNVYLYQHPIVRQLCQRLVWGVLDGDRIVRTFRPLDDGTLTDEQDGQVTVAPEARLRLVHGSLVPAETSAAWGGHFADYQVEPLFTQFGRDRYVLPEAKQDAAELTEFEGHLVEAFNLRGQATRLGYTRGPTQDGGWFYQYEKTLAGMGMKAVIHFSGNGMPEENRTVALINLHFAPTASAPDRMSFEQRRMPLRDVPGVLLSECYHDLATIAASGTGYDADWQKKVDM